MSADRMRSNSINREEHETQNGSASALFPKTPKASLISALGNAQGTARRNPSQANGLPHFRRQFQRTSPFPLLPPVKYLSFCGTKEELNRVRKRFRMRET